MIKHLSILPVFALLLCSACDGSKDVSLPKDDKKTTTTTTTTADKDTKSEDPETRSTGKTSSSTSTSSSSSTNPAGAFETKLDGLVTQKAPWGDIEISVEKARVLRGDKPAGFPSKVTHSKSSVYAVLDLKLESNGDQENDYEKRDTWDLLLKDGTRVKPLNPVGVVLQPGSAQTASLFYEVENNAKLNGASLEINGSDRSALEPLAIPLDEKSKFASQAEVADLIGESFESDSESGLSYKIVDAVYGVNLEDSGRRAPRDQRLVELTVRVAYDGDSDEKSFTADGDAPRLAFDDRVFAPADFDTRTIASGHSHDFVMVYQIDEAASYVDLVLDSGDVQDRLMRDIELPALDREPTSHDAEISGSEDVSEDEVDNSNEDSSDEVDSSDESFEDSSDSDDSGDFGDSEDQGDDSSDDSDDSEN